MLVAGNRWKVRTADVRSVKRMRTKRRLLNTVLLGGVGVGAGIGAATYHDNPCPPTAFVCLNGIGGRGLPTALGAAIGLVRGAIVGALLPNHEIIYRVNPP